MSHALLLARNDKECEHRQHRAIHGHRHGDLVERNPIEQHAHVVNGVDGDPRHAHIACHTGMVRIVTAMGSEIEGDGDTLLTGGEVAPIEGVRILSR